MKIQFSRLSVVLLVTVLAACALQPAPSPPAPEREKFLRDWAETQGYSNGRPVSVTPTPDGRHVLFLRSGPRDRVRRLYEFDVASSATRELITPEQLLNGVEEKLSVAERARRERMRLTAKGFASFELSRDGRLVVLPLSGRLYALERASGTVRTLYAGEEPAIDPQLSPDARRLAYVKAHDLYVRDLATGRERRLTQNGSEDLTHGLAEFAAQEEMSRFSGFWWSPDSQWLAYEEADHRGMERFAIGDPAKPEGGAEFFYYPRAGKANAKVRLGVISAAGGATTWARWDHERYPYLARVLWEERKAPLSVLVQTRDQREAALLEINPASGASTQLYIDKDEAWLNLSDTTPRWLADGSGFLALRENSGERELVLHDRQGKFLRVLIPGRFRFLELAGVVDRSGEIYALATPNPTEVQLLRTTAAGGDPEVLRQGQNERFVEVAREGGIYVESRTALDVPTVSEIFAHDGRSLGVLPSVAEAPPFAPSVELSMIEAQGRSFPTAVIRPRDFNPNKRYPVIVHVYGGPGVNRVLAGQLRYLQPQWFADQGAIVVMTDNRGTPRRGREWERSIKNSFATLALDDQAAVLEALARRIPQMDLKRVGIYGWSFGGYMSALAVLKRPELFKVAVAGAPVTEWRDYDTHYTERYLGMPQDNATGYDESSLLNLAPKLERPLMLVHGTSDDNVYFFHSLKLADALFKAGRKYEFLPLSSFTHMVPEPVVQQRLYTRMADFLFAELGGPQ